MPTIQNNQNNQTFQEQIQKARKDKLWNDLRKASILFNLNLPTKKTSIQNMEQKLSKIFQDNETNFTQFQKLVSTRTKQLKSQLNLPDNNKSDLISLNRKISIRTPYNEQNLKICTGCNNLEYHARCKTTKSGLQYQCVKCYKTKHDLRQKAKDEEFLNSRDVNQTNKIMSGLLLTKVKKWLGQKTSKQCEYLVGCSPNNLRSHLGLGGLDDQASKPKIGFIVHPINFDLWDFDHQRICFHYSNLILDQPNEPNKISNFEEWYKKKYNETIGFEKRIIEHIIKKSKSIQ